MRLALITSHAGFRQYENFCVLEYAYHLRAHGLSRGEAATAILRNPPDMPCRVSAKRLARILRIAFAPV